MDWFKIDQACMKVSNCEACKRTQPQEWQKCQDAEKEDAE